MGPLIDEEAVKLYNKAIQQAQKEGGRFVLVRLFFRNEGWRSCVLLSGSPSLSAPPCANVCVLLLVRLFLYVYIFGKSF